MNNTQLMATSMVTLFNTHKRSWHYVTELTLQSLYRTSVVLGDQALKTWTLNTYEPFINNDGSINGHVMDEYSLDLVAPGKFLFPMYQETGETRYVKAMQTIALQLENQPRTEEGGFWHKLRYPHQMWLDGFYMQAPFAVQYYKMQGSLLALLDDLVSQFELMYNKSMEPKSGLLLHAWDESKSMPWCNPETGLSGYVWGRALGWYCMALVDILDYIPQTDEYLQYRNRLAVLVSSLGAAVCSVQDVQTGLWWQVMDKPNEGDNYLESSASAMFSYFLQKAARKNLVTDPVGCKQAGVRAFEGMLMHKTNIDEQGILHVRDICKSAGLGKSLDVNPYRDGSFSYYTSGEPRVTDNMHGTGPLLLAALEYEYADRLA